MFVGYIYTNICIRRLIGLINIAIIGGGKVGSMVLHELNTINKCSVLGICDVASQSPGMRLAEKLGIPAYQQLEEVLHNPDLDLVIETTGSTHVKKQIEKLKSAWVDLKVIKNFVKEEHIIY